MNICGIVVEYNPLTNGHLYHIQKAKEISQCDLLVAVMSGNFTQRGEPAIVDKWQRAKAAVENGVDLVFELPFAFACESADYFAKGAIQLLNSLRCQTIVFGTETLDKKSLRSLVEQSKSEAYQKRVKLLLDRGESYPQAQAQAFTDISISLPNDLLAYSYVKQIIMQNAAIDFVPIQRTNAYHGDLSGSSASSLRQRLKNKQSISSLSPMQIHGELHDFNDYFEPLYAKLMFTDIEELNKIHLVSEGLEYRFKKKIASATNMTDFINQVKTKRYTTPRLMRTIIHVLLNDTSACREKQDVGYLRLLAASHNGQMALRELKKTASLPIISRFSEIKHPHLALELAATQLYAMPLAPTKRIGIINQEYKQIPYIKKATD